MLGTGILIYAFGQVVFTYYVWVLGHPPPMPSVATIGFLGQYPFLLLGILMLPARTIPVAARTRVALDGLMIMTAAVTFSWYFILGPIIRRGDDPVLAKVMAAAYPLVDIALIASLLVLTLRPGQRALRSAVGLLAAGLAFVVITDSVYGYERLNDIYITGTIVDVGWPVGYTLIGLGAFVLRLYPLALDDTGEVASPPTARGVWDSLVPYALVPAVGILAFYAWRSSDGNEGLTAGVYVGGGLLICLVLLRQILTIVENTRLYNRLQTTYTEMEAKNDELVRSQGELRRQKEYLEALVLNSPVAIATVDLDAKIVAWNPAAVGLFGYTQEEAVGRGIDDLVTNTPEMQAEAADYAQRVSNDKQIAAVTRRSRKDGTLVDVELLAVPVTVGGEQVGTYVMYHDITELERTRQQSESANRAKSTFLANMSHELRTPLNAVIDYSEMLAEDLTDEGGPEGLISDLEKINSGGNGLLALVNESLHPDRGLPGPHLRDELRVPIEAVIGLCETAREKAEAQGQSGMLPDLQKIHSSAERFHALAAGGPSGIEAAATPSLRPQEPGEVPSVAGPPQEDAAWADSGPLIIVDNNEINRDVLARHLHREGYTTAAAENGLRALEMVRARKFDLVLLDVMMPELDGYETLRLLKADPELREIPVIMISALDDIESVVRCIEMGAEDYLPKPFDPVLLQARTGASLEKKRLRDLEIEYLRNVDRVTSAAAAVEAGEFDPSSIERVAAREDALGQLARVFQRMAREVRAREQRLKQEVRLLRIEIDETRTARQVAEITETDYFRDLQRKADRLRSRTNLDQ